MVIVSSPTEVVGPLPFMAFKNGLYMGGDPITTYDTWGVILQVTSNTCHSIRIIGISRLLVTGDPKNNTCEKQSQPPRFWRVAADSYKVGPITSYKWSYNHYKWPKING